MTAFNLSATLIKQRFGLLCGLILAGALPAMAVERELRLDCPNTIPVSEPLVVTVFAYTDAGNGEQVGFLHVDYSIDDGVTWVGLCYVDQVGPDATYKLKPTIGKAGSKVLVRARAAFRGGLAGDVDFRGAAIRWDESWSNWAEPPARHATIKVTAH